METTWLHALGKDTDENYLAVWQARETVENGLRLGAVGNLISTTVLRTSGVAVLGAFCSLTGLDVLDMLSRSN